MAEDGGRNIGAGAVATIENQFIPGCPGDIVHTRQQLVERDIHVARHVACGKLALGTSVKDSQDFASIAMLRSIPSLANVVVLLGLILYVYAIAGVSLFRHADHAHWGSLGRAALTLFEVLTLEGWVELMDLSLAVTPWAWVYYVSFVVLAVFVVVNLFIAIVINNLEAAKREQHGEEAGDPSAIAARLTEIRDRLADIERDVRAAGRPR